MYAPGHLHRLWCHCSVCLLELQVAILNANYMAARLQDHYKVLFKGAHGKRGGRRGEGGEGGENCAQRCVYIHVHVHCVYCQEHMHYHAL